MYNLDHDVPDPVVSPVTEPAIPEVKSKDVDPVRLADSSRGDIYVCFEGPMGAHLKQEVRDKIGRGEYVELFTLLPLEKFNLDAVSKPDDHKKEDEERRRYRLIPRTFSNWLQAFSTLASIIATKNPEHCAGLFCYQESIHEAYRVYGGQAWLRYDEEFRQRLAVRQGVRWDHRDIALWLRESSAEVQNPSGERSRARNARLLTSDGTPSLPPVDNRMGGSVFGSPLLFLQSPRGSPVPEPTAVPPAGAIQPFLSAPAGHSASGSSASAKKGTCWQFNDSSCKRGSQCRFRHECSGCGGSHPQFKCFKRNKQDKSGNSNNSGGKGEDAGGQTEEKRICPLPPPGRGKKSPSFPF
ncbi:uncharacterized protein RCH25_017994 [Pelodytes ibericus]